ncbi:ester cyclase [Pendulispora brunnea]|uniref:Ester cyclase n=1 Tax=Pendulispora brunnea TaxID=2905690 RepID=A0ABZ2KKZ3_9BACT
MFDLDAAKSLIFGTFNGAPPASGAEFSPQVATSAAIFGFPPLPPGIGGLQFLVGFFRSAFPDLVFECTKTVGQGSSLACRWVARGTHGGRLFNIHPTGRPVQFSGSFVFSVSQGKVVSLQIEAGLLELVPQLGMAPSFGAQNQTNQTGGHVDAAR